jgi:hypothetical protein
MESFKPRILPHDFIDILIGVVIGTMLIVVSFVIPSVLAIWLSGNVVVGVATFLGIYCVWLLFWVRKLELSERGIRFVRVLGWPALVPWSDVESISLAPRLEVVLRGWIWPLFPPREMTASLTALGHYRIRFTAGTAYFPPANVEPFEIAIRRFCEREEAYSGILFHSAQRVFPADSSTEL